jgi:hypothetical protein
VRQAYLRTTSLKNVGQKAGTNLFVVPAGCRGGRGFRALFRVDLTRFRRMARPMACTLQPCFLMNVQIAVLGLLLSGFFAIACIRASVPASPGSGASLMNLFLFPGRIERLRRSRWQWFAMVSFMIVLRLQQQLPVALELMAALQFLLFLALPTRARRAEGRGNAAAV